MADSDNAFDANTDLSGAIPIIHLKGEITSDAEDVLLAAYESVPSDRKGRIILNFETTKYINSSGIAILIQLITRSSENEQKIEFINLSPHFRKVMDIVGLTDFVQIFDSLDDAIKQGG
ncbi:MAG: STAS domain-containing protein [Leptospiraceae bacterium]|nr:STAS domain-containing protein [Leptospiraceae bacterium]MCB1321745.1 STAS domain-containing protein [Leptospiraceae bacterium]